MGQLKTTGERRELEELRLQNAELRNLLGRVRRLTCKTIKATNSPRTAERRHGYNEAIRHVRGIIDDYFEK